MRLISWTDHRTRLSVAARVAAVFFRRLACCTGPVSDGGHHREREHHQRDMPVPAVPGAGFVVVQAELVLGGLEAVLDGPTMPSCLNNPRIRALTSRSDDAHNSSVVSIDATDTPRSPNRVMVAHRFRESCRMQLQC